MPRRGRACHGNGERQRRDVDGKRKQSRTGSSRSVLSRCLPPRPCPSRSLKTHPGREDSAGHARHHGLGQHRERELRWRREEKRREEEEIGVRAAGRRFDYFFSSKERLLFSKAPPGSSQNSFCSLALSRSSVSPSFALLLSLVSFSCPSLPGHATYSPGSNHEQARRRLDARTVRREGRERNRRRPFPTMAIARTNAPFSPSLSFPTRKLTAPKTHTQ